MPEEITTKYALVVGDRGVGKTTLVSGLSKLSCSEFFVLIDASGCEDAGATQKLIHTYGISDQTRISAVFLVIKYDNRFERMPDSYFAMEDELQIYADRIVIMVSHFDYSKSPEKDQISIREVFEEECPNVKNVRCYSDQAIDAKLANFMNNCISTLNGNPAIIDEQKSFMQNEQSINDTNGRHRSGSSTSRAESSRSREKISVPDTRSAEISQSYETKTELPSTKPVSNDCSSPMSRPKKKRKWYQRVFPCFFAQKIR